MKNEFDEKWKFLRQFLVIPKKEIDKTRREKANIEIVGKIIFWFTDDFWFGKLFYGQAELRTPSSYHY